jgi:hypothetical protein
LSDHQAHFLPSGYTFYISPFSQQLLCPCDRVPDDRCMWDWWVPGPGLTHPSLPWGSLSPLFKWMQINTMISEALRWWYKKPETPGHCLEGSHLTARKANW